MKEIRILANANQSLLAFHTMKASPETLQLLQRVLYQVAGLYPLGVTPLAVTDLTFRVSPDDGALLVHDDDGRELARCVVSAWADAVSGDAYAQARADLQEVLRGCPDVVETLPILRPFSFVLADEEDEPLGDLLVVGDGAESLSADLMVGLDDDLDLFWRELAVTV